MKNVFAYARVSTALQSADNQLVTLREVAKRNEWNIVREYTDVMSGVKGRDKRVQFDAMLISAMRREVDGIFLHVPYRNGIALKRPHSAIRKEDYKLIKIQDDKSIFLFKHF